MVVSLYVLLEMIAIVFCLHFLYGERIRCDIVTISFIIVEFVWMKVIYFYKLGNNPSLLLFPIMIWYCMVRFGKRIRMVLVNSTLCVLIIGSLQASIMLILFFVLKIQVMNEQELLIINLLVFLIVTLFLGKCKLEKISKVLQNNDKIIILSIVIVIIGVIFFVINYKFDNGMNVIYYAVLLVSIILVIVAIIDIGKHKMKAKEIEAELRLHKLYEESFRNLIDDIRARQHEFDNHINTIYSQHYLYHTYEELVEAQNKYCKSIEKGNNYNKLLSHGNPIVLGFLYSKFSEAEKIGIDVEYKIKIGELKCNVPIYKIIELIGNLINNAMEALQKESDLSCMKVVMVEQEYEIAVDICNECKNISYDKIQSFFKKGYSEKGVNRGYGLYNVKKICEEYDIMLESTLKDLNGRDELHFMIIINKPL